MDVSGLHINFLVSRIDLVKYVDKTLLFMLGRLGNFNFLPLNVQPVTVFFNHFNTHSWSSADAVNLSRLYPIPISILT